MLAQLNKENKSWSKRLGSWWNRHWETLAIFSIIVLVILALFGLWRLKVTTPKKEPIRVEEVM